MPDPKPWRVAIVVPTADPGREPAQTAIAQARRTTAHLEVSIHVVQSSGPGFRFSRSINRGIAEAPDADAWILLNDDCFMDDGWVEAMMDTARRHPEVGLVGAVLRFPSGRLQHAGGHLMNPFAYVFYAVSKLAPFWGLRAFFASLFRGVPFFGHYTRLRAAHRLDLVTGACMLITRSCHERIGGYDEGFEFTFEDVDYCLRALQAGFEIALAVDARGVHLERATGGGLRHAIARSEAFFHSRWGQRDRVQAVTRRAGRHGIYHGSGPAASCACVKPAPGAAPLNPVWPAAGTPGTSAPPLRPR
jgi:hypothetical protein